MKILFILLGAMALAGCARVATVREIQPRRVGFQTAEGDPRAALDYHVSAAETAWHRLERNPADSAARDDYNFAVARIVSGLKQARLAPWIAPVKLGSHTLVWKRDPQPERNPANYEFIPADQLELKGKYIDVRETLTGLGAPLVAKRIADPAHEMAPTPHFYFCVTAVARFKGSSCEISIEEPLKHETIQAGRHRYPLAADFTAPLAMMLVEMEPERLNVPRLLHPARFASTTRIARLEPYNPKKAVVLVVHGLASSPATWFPLLNHLRGDREIRNHYQFWFYSYPSGYPYPYSAATLRKELDVAEKRYPSDKKMVVVGHSMGGCISRLLITDTKQKIWDQMFTVPPDRMDLAPQHKQVLTESSIFAHRPEIGRVIFISTPHRGSELATQWVGRAFSRMVEMPATLLSIGIDQARYQKHAEGHKHLARYPDSVDTLSPDNEFVVALDTVPLRRDIPYHTIAGDRGRGDSPNSSDGVVPYWSSHQAGARSELIVPSHHGAHQAPEGIAEVARILKENLSAQAPRRQPQQNTLRQEPAIPGFRDEP